MKHLFDTTKEEKIKDIILSRKIHLLYNLELYNNYNTECKVDQELTDLDNTENLNFTTYDSKKVLQSLNDKQTQLYYSLSNNLFFINEQFVKIKNLIKEIIIVEDSDLKLPKIQEIETILSLIQKEYNKVNDQRVGKYRKKYIPFLSEQQQNNINDMSNDFEKKEKILKEIIYHIQGKQILFTNNFISLLNDHHTHTYYADNHKNYNLGKYEIMNIILNAELDIKNTKNKNYLLQCLCEYIGNEEISKAIITEIELKNTSSYREIIQEGIQKQRLLFFSFNNCTENFKTTNQLHLYEQMVHQLNEINAKLLLFEKELLNINSSSNTIKYDILSHSYNQLQSLQSKINIFDLYDITHLPKIHFEYLKMLKCNVWKKIIDLSRIICQMYNYSAYKHHSAYANAK